MKHLVIFSNPYIFLSWLPLFMTINDYCTTVQKGMTLKAMYAFKARNCPTYVERNSCNYAPRVGQITYACPLMAIKSRI